MYIHPDIPDNRSGYPLKSDFVITQIEENKGLGVYSLKFIPRGQLVALFTGEILSEITQHSLQISHDQHIYDPHFAGFLLHSCSPNTTLDMEDRSIWAIKDIHPNEPLTMDYALTEDYLFRQFKCLCNASNCRGWISGRRESVNTDGLKWLKKSHKKDGISLLKAV